MREIDSIGFGSIGIVAITSIFMGAVITIQTVYNLVNPLVPVWAVGIVTRDSIIIEFSPTMICLVLAGKVGSSIASEIGTMRVTEQIDALEIMGINSSGYLVFPWDFRRIDCGRFIRSYQLCGFYPRVAGYFSSVQCNVCTYQNRNIRFSHRDCFCLPGILYCGRCVGSRALKHQGSCV
jgi:hypothetical protein